MVGSYHLNSSRHGQSRPRRLTRRRYLGKSAQAGPAPLWSSKPAYRCARLTYPVGILTTSLPSKARGG